MPVFNHYSASIIVNQNSFDFIIECNAHIEDAVNKQTIKHTHHANWQERLRVTYHVKETYGVNRDNP